MLTDPQQYKVNITRKVTGKMEAGDMILYHNKSAIGKIDMNTKEIEMYDGFMMQDHSIYAIGEKPVYTDYYAHNCDMGWCQ